MSSDGQPPDSTTSGDPLLGLARLVADEPRNQAAARTLLRAVAPGMLRVVRGILGTAHPDVPDVCQEATVAFLQALPDFRGQATVTHFACRIAVFSAMNARRRARFDRRPVVASSEDLPSGSLDPDEQAAAERRRQAVRQLLDELPPAQGEALALHIMLGYTVQETASAVAAPLDTVRSRLRRALSALRTRIGDDRALLEVVRGST